MTNPIHPTGSGSAAPAQPAAPVRSADRAGVGGDFAALLREQLHRVSEMQNEADERVQALVTGQSQNLTEVFTATRKAQVAFSLLMEIRNKLVDAYQELQNMRV
ncbi:MAG: flagellar hook-basal body complex protein FliE [Phycisphaerae bacterium]|jgi:flagellar hook-basal body complex protein FliE